MTSYDLRPLAAADEPQVRQLLARAGSAAPSTPEEGSAPDARAWVLALGERIVGHCAALPSTVWIGGEEQRFARVTLPALDPEHRAALERDGAHERLATSVVEASLTLAGDAALQALVHEDDWRAMERLFGLEIVRTQSLLALELDRALAAPAPSDGLVELTAFGEETRWLWDRCAGDFGASAIRDPRFLASRFTDTRGPRVLGLRDPQGVLRGYAAWRPSSGPTGTHAAIVDWLVPPAETEVGARLFAACAARARAAGARALCAILPGWSPWFGAFQGQGALVLPSRYLVVARARAPRFDSFWLRDNWWYQPTDFGAVELVPRS